MNAGVRLSGMVAAVTQEGKQIARMMIWMSGT